MAALPHFYPAILQPAVQHLHILHPSFGGQGRDIYPDHLVVYHRIKAHVRGFNIPSDIADNGLVIRCHGNRLAVRYCQSITVTPYDQSIIGDIRRDIEAANVGFNPVIDNQVIRINVPPLTAERRMEYVKMLHSRLEDGRVKVRQGRHEVMSEYKRSAEEGNLNEDERERQEDELQKLTDEMMERIEEIGKAKEEELVTI